MIEYGYINENGYLKTKQLQEYTEKYREKGIIKTRKITIEEQTIELSNAGWKPVDELDNEKLKAPDGYFIRVIPYDAGERISFKYEQVFDEQKIRREIEELKKALTSTDYKVIKCYEASLIGEELPYDIKVLHKERQQIRNRINTLQNENHI